MADAVVSQAQIIYGYWNLQGLGQSIRLILEYVGENYKEIRYEFKDAGAGDVEKSWFTAKKMNPRIIGDPEKDEPGLPFPNIPYYTEDRPDGTKIRMTQSFAIIKYLGRKYNLLPEDKSPKTMAKLEMLEMQLRDVNFNLIYYNTDEGFHKFTFGDYYESCDGVFEMWEKFLSSTSQDSKWLMGNDLTYVDFLLYDVLYVHFVFKPSLKERFTQLAAFYRRFEDLPPIKAYVNSPKFVAWPLLGPYAKKFGFFKQS